MGIFVPLLALILPLFGRHAKKCSVIGALALVYALWDRLRSAVAPGEIWDFVHSDAMYICENLLVLGIVVASMLLFRRGDKT